MSITAVLPCQATERSRTLLTLLPMIQIRRALPLGQEPLYYHAKLQIGLELFYTFFQCYSLGIFFLNFKYLVTKTQTRQALQIGLEELHIGLEPFNPFFQYYSLSIFFSNLKCFSHNNTDKASTADTFRSTAPPSHTSIRSATLNPFFQ